LPYFAFVPWDGTCFPILSYRAYRRRGNRVISAYFIGLFAFRIVCHGRVYGFGIKNVRRSRSSRKKHGFGSEKIGVGCGFVRYIIGRTFASYLHTGIKCFYLRSRLVCFSCDFIRFNAVYVGCIVYKGVFFGIEKGFDTVRVSAFRGDYENSHCGGDGDCFLQKHHVFTRYLRLAYGGAYNRRNKLVFVFDCGVITEQGKEK